MTTKCLTILAAVKNSWKSIKNRLLEAADGYVDGHKVAVNSTNKHFGGINLDDAVKVKQKT